MPAPEAAPANPLVVSIIEGLAPRPLKLSAARGALPLTRAELVRILIVLAHDVDDDVRSQAARRLISFPQEEMVALLSDPGVSADVLEHFGCAAGSDPRLREAVLINPVTPDSTLLKMAPDLEAPLLDRILLNETRLIETPGLLEALEANGNLAPAQRSRIEEIRRHFLRPTPVPEPEPEPVPGPEPPAEQAAAPVEPEVEEPEVEEAADEGEDRGAIHRRIELASRKILKMNVPERIQLAMKGNREERFILISDASKPVQQAVLGSPKLSESEVEVFAKSRTASEEVLRIIAGSRDWMKSYTIAHALATNPKTPPAIAINLVARFTNRDLKLVADDRNVPEAVRRHARKVTLLRDRSPGKK